MPVTRSTDRASVLLALMLLVLAAGGCKSSSAPTKPVPTPTPTPAGQVQLIKNQSLFVAQASAATCTDTGDIRLSADDFTPISVHFELTCSAVAQGEGHSANMDVDATVTYAHDAPGGGLSQIRFQALADANRSATGLASSGAVNRVVLHFEVSGDPVAFRLVGRIGYADHFSERVFLRPVGAPREDWIVEQYGEANGIAGERDLDISGTLPEGVYEIWMELSTHDWFEETMDLALQFSNPAS